ncbi:homing endonuclease associated repeat-containing protein [Halorientalis halophila]|uniref:homing endonuclease associated repeat-containing protein n=1 Tax=Halorientalis halophila TaxID=3108499 RepID=UPI00300852C1
MTGRTSREETFVETTEQLNQDSDSNRAHNRISEKQLISELNKLSDELGHTPSQSDMNDDGAYSATTYGTRFGSWSAALKIADLEPQKAGLDVQISEKDVCGAIQALGDQLGRVPTAPEMEEHGRYSLKTAQSRFGSWNEALRASGFAPNMEKRISRDRLLDEIRRLAEELGHPPSTNDLKQDGRFSHRPYFRKFDDWESVITEAGYEHRGWPSGPDHPGWKDETTTFYYGSNWEEERKQRLELDDFICQMPGCEMTRDLHLDRFGRDLNVHHIIPAPTFGEGEDVDFDKMNRIDNLVTLCIPHHRYWEQLSPLKPDIRE